MAVTGVVLPDPRLAMEPQPPDSAPQAPAPSRRRGPGRQLTLIAISLTTVLWVAASLAGLVMAMMSVMMFDSPGSTEQPGTVTLALAVVAFPFSCWLAIVLSWILFFLRRWVASLACTALPLLPVAVGAGAWVWIDVVQKGSLGKG